jgi:hypothetical protein
VISARIAIPLVGLLLLGCVGKGINDPGTENTFTDNRRGFPAMRISAIWTNGKTGLPSDRAVTVPPGFVGTFCAASDFVVENHPTQYTNVFPNGGATFLVVGSACASPTNVVVCRSGGAGIVQTAPFGVCADDPRQTLAANVSMMRVGAVWTTSTTLAVELFYCTDASEFNFLLSNPKLGVGTLDCVEK